MFGIIGIAALLTVLGLSLVITRIASVALIHTGLSEEEANFQARSAFTGTGFTTSESEEIVNHPVRRRIIMALMIARSAGIISIIISLILSFGTSESREETLARLAWLVGGIGLLWLLSLSPLMRKAINYLISLALDRWTDLHALDYVSLLKLEDTYRIHKMKVNNGDWIAERTVSECRLHDEGVTILGIIRNDKTYAGVPRPDTTVHPDDVLILYGRQDRLDELTKRRAGSEGEVRHSEAVQDQELKEDEQERRDREYNRKRSD